MGRVSGLGHFGIYIDDMSATVDFYTKVLGLVVTDYGDSGRVTFLSAQPSSEHHEIALVTSDQRTSARSISFHVDSVRDLKEMYDRVRAEQIEVIRTVNHGIALGIYMRDPEGNVVQVYWSTGKDYPQPFAEPIDFDLDESELLDVIEGLAPREAKYPHYYGQDVGKRVVKVDA